MGASYLLAIFGLILVLIAPILAQPLPLGAQLAGLGYLGILASLAKSPPGSSAVNRLAIGGLTGISMLAITTSALYYLTSITTATLSLAALITLSICLSIAYKHNKATHLKDPEKNTWLGILAAIFAALPLVASLAAMSAQPITAAVRTPWTAQNLLPILAPLALSVLLTITLHAKKILTSSSVALLTGLTAFTIVSFAALTYPLGYGFDPHIHRATLEHIAHHGTITPKPPYYIAMYGLELTASLLFGVAFSTLDPFLAPILFGLVIVIAIGTLESQKISGLAALALLPLGAFIQTTPNAVSLTLLLATVISASSKDFWRSWLFALAALLAHPIAGLPALVVALAATVNTKIPSQYKNPTLLCIFLLSAITLPTAFILDAHFAHRLLEINTPTLSALANTITPSISLLKQGHAALDTIYSLASLITLTAGALAIYGYINASKDERLFGALSLGTLVSAVIITTTFNFTYLIAYEQNDFARRAVIIANLLALPLLLKGLGKIYEKITLQSFTFQISATTVVALALSASTYLAYPRHDAYATSAGFNVSQADLQAVQIIENYAGKQTYTVLGNQAISAAALQTFGFTDRYLAHDTYFYPIPTSGQLYADFLSFTQTAQSPVLIEQVFERTQAELVIIVIHDYWWNAKNITQNTASIANNVLPLPNGLQGFVFTKPVSY